MCCVGNLNTLKEISEREKELGITDSPNAVPACPLIRNGKKPSIFKTQILPVLVVFALAIVLHQVGLY